VVKSKELRVAVAVADPMLRIRRAAVGGSAKRLLRESLHMKTG
jgi:hypothetical protein